MPDLDLSALNGAELRRLLDSTRDHGLAAQSYQILQEMARRRETGAGHRLRARLGSRRPEEHHIISVDLGDPLDREEDLLEAEPEPDGSPEAAPARAPRQGPPRRWGLPAGTFVAGAAMGMVIGAWFGGAGREAPSPRRETAGIQAELAAPAQSAPLSAAAAAVPEPTPDSEPDPALALAAAEEQAAAQPAADAPEAEPEAVAATAAAEASSGEAEDAPAAAAGDCATAPSPADRTICEDPRLRRLQQNLRRAYAEALDAHADRTLLRQRQLAWRDARNTVTDRTRLAALYEERIRKLEAATKDARRQR